MHVKVMPLSWMGSNTQTTLLIGCLAGIFPSLGIGGSLGLLPHEEENVPMMKVETVSGMLTNLPCNITPSVPGDRVLIVLWYKDGYGKPIYSFDLRTESLESEGLLWANEDGDNIPRAQLNVKSQPTAFLSLLGVEERDGGIYRCRVDFKKSPTRFWKVDLTVIVPPTLSILLDEKGSEVERTVGPYNEGSTLVITCDILGGWPSSDVTWWRDGAVIDDTWEEISPGKSRNTMKLENLSRGELNTELECRGNNNNHTQPVVTSIGVQLNLPPLNVEIHQEIGGPISADKNVTFFCHSQGARPNTTITWFNFLGHELQPYNTEVLDSNNLTISSLKYAPNIQEDGKSLRCRSENPILPGSAIENIIMLEVSYPPQLWLRLGQNLAQDKIKEGDDVYFDCDVQANPRAQKLIWKHNGEIIKRDLNNGFIMNEGNLIIQSVKRSSAGLYSCHTVNKEGSGNSNVVSLTIQYTPVCLSQGQAVGAAKGEEARVVCQVESNPPPTHFKWQFNTSTELRPIPASDVFADEEMSVASYVPTTELDYGSLLCWGFNDLGKQKEPCVFTILPAGRPEPVTNCSVNNQTFNSVLIACQPGYDGGVTQQFVLKIIPSAFQSMNIPTSNTIESVHYPQFKLEGLPSGSEIKVAVYAKNVKGKSDETEVKFWTMRIASELSGEKRVASLDTNKNPLPQRVTPLVWIFMAIMSVLVLVIILVGLIMRAWCSEKRQDKAKFVRANRQSGNEHEGKHIVRNNNPDLIPESGINNGLLEDRTESHKNSVSDKSDTVWLLKRGSICVPDHASKYTSFVLSPSSHSRDFKQNGGMKNQQAGNGYYCTLPRNLNQTQMNIQTNGTSSFKRSCEEINENQYSQKTLPNPRRRNQEHVQNMSGVLMGSGPGLMSSVPELERSQEIFAPVPPAFADSSVEDINKINGNVTVKIGMKMTRF